jgi:GT2 family glycosyltransferase
VSAAAVAPVPAREEGPRATCVVVAFHRSAALAGLLEALDDPALEVVVVNVEADADVRAVARERGAQVLDVVWNCGFASAVNRGVRSAGHDVVVFLNDDVRIEARDVRRLVTAVNAGDADVAVPRVMDANGVVERTIAAVPGPVGLAREWLLLPDHPVEGLVGRLPVEKWRAPTRPERIDAAAAVVVAVRIDLLRAEPLPESYFLYWEESDWFWRLRARGAVVQYRPDAACVHTGGRHDVRPEKSRLLARNAVRYVRQTQGRAAALAALPVVVLWNLRLVLCDLVRFLLGPTRGRWERVQARGAGLGAALTSWDQLR